MDKKEELDNIGELYVTKKDYNWCKYLMTPRFKVVKGYLNGPDILEVGCGRGIFSTKLCEEEIYNIHSIDGSKLNIENTKKMCNSDNITFECCLFEEFESDKKFDDIIISCSLEHVDDPILVLSHLKQFLKKEGKIHIVVPNAMSMHRQLGKEMGLLENEWDLNKYDISVGHKRVYTEKLLREHIELSGLEILFRDGIMFKPMSNSQINVLINIRGFDIVEGFYKLGRRHPEISAELYFCCKL